MFYLNKELSLEEKLKILEQLQKDIWGRLPDRVLTSGEQQDVLRRLTHLESFQRFIAWEEKNPTEVGQHSISILE